MGILSKLKRKEKTNLKLPQNQFQYAKSWNSNQSNNLLDIFELFFCSISFFYTQGNKGIGENFFREINSFTGSSYTISGRIQDPLIFLLCCQFVWGISLCLMDRETQEEIFGGTSSLVGQFLHPSPVQSSRSIQCMNTVQFFLNKFFYLVLAIWNVGPVYASRIEKLRKRFLVEPAPL